MILLATNRGEIKRETNNILCFEVGQNEENIYELEIKMNKILSG